MEPPKKKRKIITQDARAVIVNVYKFLKEEYIFTMIHKDCNCDLSHLRNISRRTADATGVSLRTLVRLLAEDRQENTQTNNINVYRFKKAKSVSTIADAEKIRQDVDLMESAIQAEAVEADLSHVEDGNVEIKLGPIKVKKELDNTEETLQLVEVKKEIEEKVKKETVKEELHWKDVEVKTEVGEEIHWKEVEIETEAEETSIYLDGVDIKEEAVDYEITIDEERKGC